MNTELWTLFGGILAGGLSATAVSIWFLRRKPAKPPSPTVENPAEDYQARLNTVIQLNRSLAESTDESQLLNTLLELMIKATGTAGATYIPFDELGQPLAQISQGVTPRFPYQPWASQLTSTAAVEICRACQKLHKDVDAECPLADNPYAPEGEITCLVVERGTRRLGIVNLYHHPGQKLAAGDVAFMQDLLTETSLAVDNLRFHNQEMATLRQLQMVRRSADDTAGILSRLLENTAEVLDCDWLILHLQQDSVRPGTIIRGRQADSRPGNKTLNELTALLRDETKPVLRTPGDGFTLPIGISSLAAVPVLTTSGKYLGSLAACRLDSNSFEARSVHILETTASQVSLLLENEQKILEMEYRVVMDERSRLAREIHDGLAQNLAFLKLQTAQMNGLLTRGELEELGEMIRTNQQVLTDAYAETRQAINHLRLFPQPGVRSWLNEMVQDFRQRGETTIELSIQKDPETLPVEIQLQLIRILQEALNNIRKHSRAQQVQISIRGYENDLILEIHDDGRGFLPEDLPSLSQYGLRGMRERSEMIGAEFQIISQPGGGTTIRLQLPYAFTEEAPL